MAQPGTVLSVFAMVLHTALSESGCTSADGDGTLGDDEPDNFDIDCFSQLEIKDSFSSLTCNFTELPPYNTNYTLSLCSMTLNVIHITSLLRSRTTRKNTINLSNSRFALHHFLFHMESHFSEMSEMSKRGSSLIVSSQVMLTLRRNDCHVTLAYSTKEDNDYACSNMKKQEDVFFVQFIDILSNRDVCMYSEMKRRVCRSLVITDIVKPEVPFAINITYEREANEYLIRYCTPHSRKKYLKDKLIHQVAYRQKEGTWKTIESPYLQIKLLGQNLENEASYEVKVRSQPNGDYFKGTWSEWSTSKSFRTARERHSTENYSSVVMVILSILGFMLSVAMIALIVVFWENRIKPAVWPNLPDHKKTLEQLCKKPKNNFDTSFNPESFGYVHIHKVDGLWAKAELENFLQPSTAPETSLPEKFRSGSDLKMIPAMADKTNLHLPVSYEALHRLLGTSQRAPTEGSCSCSTYEVCHSNRVPQHHDGFSLSSTCALDPSGQPHPDPLNDDTVSQMLPNSDMRSPNNEEAYVTMSSFYKIQ